MKRAFGIGTVCLAVCLGSAQGLRAQEKGKNAAAYSKQLDLFVKGQRPAAINDLIKEIAGVDDPRVAVLLPAAAVALPSAANYQAALDAVAALTSEASVGALAALVDKPKGDYRRKVLVLEGFARRSDQPSLDALVKALKDDDVNVQIAAIRGARARRKVEPVSGLIDIFGERARQRDRAWFEARLALVELTGKDFETAEDWRKFWEPVKDTFDPNAAAKESGPTQVQAVKKTADSVEFFGNEIFSRNLIFVIDVSGSMFMYDESDDYKGNNAEEDRQRLRRAREELTKAVKKLSKGTLFNIITFSNKVVPWQKQRQPATPSSIASALKFVNDFKAIGATHTDDALKMAFDDLGADTIVLLSDGAPAHQRGDSEALVKKILAWVRDINAARKVTIHTFGFESAGTWPKKVPFDPGGRLPPPPGPEELKVFVDFLKTLASESGGIFQPIK